MVGGLGGWGGRRRGGELTWSGTWNVESRNWYGNDGSIEMYFWQGRRRGREDKWTGVEIERGKNVIYGLMRSPFSTSVPDPPPFFPLYRLCYATHLANARARGQHMSDCRAVHLGEREGWSPMWRLLPLLIRTASSRRPELTEGDRRNR